MISLRCPQCGTTLPVAENKIGTRIFVCPNCAHPLEAPGPAGDGPASRPAAALKPVPLDTSEDKTMAPDASLMYVQQKLREAKARRSEPEVPTPSVEKNRLPQSLLWGGGAAAGLLILGTLAFLLANRGPKSAPAVPETPASEPVVQTQPDIVLVVPPDAVPKNKPATVAELSRSLKEGKPPERLKALRELAKRGAEARLALAAVVAVLKDPDAEMRNQARETLSRMGPAKTADVPVFAASLRDASPELRIFAAGELGGLGRQAKSQLLFLRVQCLDADAKVQEAARAAVTRIEGDLIGSLIRGLQDKSASVRAQSAHELAEMGDNARAALPALVEALADGNSAVRLAVIDTFVVIGPDGILILGEALRDRNPQVRLTAINALGRMGPDARFVLPELIACLGMDGRTREETLQALTRIGDYAIPYLVQTLEREKDARKHQPLIDALERMGPVAVPVLQTVLKKANAEANKAAAVVLSKSQSQPSPPRKEHTGVTGLIQSQLRAWFAGNDSNKDDFLDKDELAHAIRGQLARAYDYVPPGQKPRQFSSRDFRRYPDYALLSRLDRDNDGKISRDEFERWSYDYSDYLKKVMDEQQRIKQAQDRLMERNLSEAMRLQREAAVAQTWANYNTFRNLQNASFGDIYQMQWMQRWALNHLPRR